MHCATILSISLSLVAAHALPAVLTFSEGVVPIGADGLALDGSSILLDTPEVQKREEAAVNGSSVLLDAPVIQEGEEGTLQTRGINAQGYLCNPRLIKHDYASCYVEYRTQIVAGWQQKVTNTIGCSTKACKIDKSYSYQATQSFGFSIGVNADVGIGAFKLGASASAQWSWSTTTVSGSTSGFDLEQGDEGYIAFWPKLRESCGDMSVTRVPPEMGPNGRPSLKPGPIPPFTGAPDQENVINACGQTPYKLPDGSADGLARFCYTGGPKKGQGCEHPNLNP